MTGYTVRVTNQPDATEVVVKQYEPLRNATKTDGYDKAFEAVNSMFDAH